MVKMAAHLTAEENIHIQLTYFLIATMEGKDEADRYLKEKLNEEDGRASQ